MMGISNLVILMAELNLDFIWSVQMACANCSTQTDISVKNLGFEVVFEPAYKLASYTSDIRFSDARCLSLTGGQRGQTFWSLKIAGKEEASRRTEKKTGHSSSKKSLEMLHSLFWDSVYISMNENNGSVKYCHSGQPKQHFDQRVTKSERFLVV